MPEQPTSATEGRGSSSGFAAFLDLPNDSPKKTLLVAFLLCLVCAVLVSTAAVTLKPLQIRNQNLDRQRNILEVTQLLGEDAPVEDLFRQIEPKVVDLETGDYVTSIDPAEYDQRKAARDPDQSVAIPPERDVAGIRQRAKYATVYLVNKDGRADRVVLPVHGSGLWSTLYGFIVLERDTNTIFGLQFYEHRETAGLGGEVDNPRWRAKWRGKLAFDAKGEPRIEVVRGTVSPGDAAAKYKVDGLAGATLTSQGVTNMLRYWLGNEGFGPYLAKVRRQVEGGA